MRKNRTIAVLLASLGTVTPLGGLHKFYLGQPLWGIFYLILWSSQIPHVACVIEAVWYMVQDQDDFDRRFNRSPVEGRESTSIPPTKIDPLVASGDLADALRELDRLRADGLMSQYEFEQKRRQLIDPQSVSAQSAARIA